MLKIMNDVKNRIESIETAIAEIKSLDISGSQEGYRKAQSGITIWVEPEYKEKYDRLQDLSGRKLGKLIQKLIRSAIDSVEKWI